MILRPRQAAPLLLTGLLACASSSVPAARVAPQDGLDADAAAAESGQAPIEIALDGAPFATVVTEGAAFPYVYPLYAPGGVALTRGFPMDPQPGEAHDHPHHRSMWTAHGNVNGVDFWHKGERAGTIVTRARRIERSGTRVVLTLEWLDDAGDVLLDERRTYDFAGAADERWIDVASHFSTPLESVVFGDTKEGTFALRLRPELRLKGEHAQGSARNQPGDTDKDVWGKRAAWVHYSAPVDGQTIGVAIFDHPDNPRSPTWWHARDYGLFAANPFGIHDFEGRKDGRGDLELERGKSLVFRHRVFLHRGVRGPTELEAAFEIFATGAGR